MADLDVVVFGASGVTGRRVAAYLQRQGASWAAAGRDAGKVSQVLSEEGVSAPETIVADLDDPRSLAAMAERAKVVLDVVGPYTLYGRPVIEACVSAGAHYADLTGEIPFVGRVIDEFGSRAAEAGVKVVQVCGFEALPPDLAVLLAAETVRARHGEPLAEADAVVSVERQPLPPRPSDLLSGGTLQSTIEIAKGDDNQSLRDPACLVPDGATAEAIRRTSPIKLAPRRAPDGAMVAPMVPAAYINPAVIHRTAALVAADAGERLEPFRYREGVAISGGPATLPLRAALAGVLSGTQAAVGAIATAPAGVRRRVAGALGSVLPSSGFGPAPDRLEGWRWRLTVRGRTRSGREVRVEVEGDGHPGYLTTARMLGEAGLLLAEPGATPQRAGCLTPAAALGTERIERFDRAGLRFRVV